MFRQLFEGVIIVLSVIAWLCIPAIPFFFHQNLLVGLGLMIIAIIVAIRFIF